MSSSALWYGAGGVVLLAMLLEYEPKWGGWLLLLVVLGLLLLNRNARAIVEGNGTGAGRNF